MRAIVLAAGSGNRLRSAFEDPKCLIPIGGVPLLARYMEGFSWVGIREVILVLGYRMEKVVEYAKSLNSTLSILFLENKAYGKGSTLSLLSAKDWLNGDLLLMDGDLCFEKDFLAKAIACPKPNFFLIDSNAVNDGEAVLVGFKNHRAVSLSRGLEGDFDLIGEWAGVLKLSPDGSSMLCDVVSREVEQGNIDGGYEFVIPQIFDHIDLSYELADGIDWVEIDFPGDIEKAQKMFQMRKGVDKDQ